ncbi:hypothetical protein [Veillonella nakazawae]|uniref:Uncharacterized protein n=1 Tax=Veillonella nakazawae TaxID=2682456 RepID=A0ABM7HEG2_9FIRM|nr:hypothetical protein [Veillonella nakazawae]BBU35422.1 hypothetical protein VEIT17_18680 [Veillonella nakazawae]
MVQRILMLALVLLAFTMPTEAITYQELKTSPQFKLVYQHEYAKGSPIVNEGGMYVYLNTYSVEVQKYAPPQYTLSAIYYVVHTSHYQAVIMENKLTVNYDANYSLATLIKSSHMMNPSPSMMALIEASESKSGLFMTDSDSAIYTLDGVLIKTLSLKNTRNLPIHRKHVLMYDLADAMFMAAYQQHFDDIVVQ